MNYGEIKKFDTSDGEGIRVALYVSGCNIKCPGCHNKMSQDFCFGKKFTSKTVEEILTALDKSYIKGLSILGGEPLAIENREEVSNLISIVKEKFPEKDIWLWTGYTYENLIKEESGEIEQNKGSLRNIFSKIDVLIDGPFILSLRDISDNNKWRGSTNQRVLRKLHKNGDEFIND